MNPKPMAADDSPYKPGDPPPGGYLNWHAWAEVQDKAGLRQKRCSQCRLWKFPQELSGPERPPLRHSTKENGDCPHWCKACAAERAARDGIPLPAAAPKSGETPDQRPADGDGVAVKGGA
jgi:hypothetical protein